MLSLHGVHTFTDLFENTVVCIFNWLSVEELPSFKVKKLKSTEVKALETR